MWRSWLPFAAPDMARTPGTCSWFKDTRALPVRSFRSSVKPPSSYPDASVGDLKPPLTTDPRLTL